MKKICGNCTATKPHDATHVQCLCIGSKHCNCLMSVNHGGCKCWNGQEGYGNGQ